MTWRSAPPHPQPTREGAGGWKHTKLANREKHLFDFALAAAAAAAVYLKSQEEISLSCFYDSSLSDGL